MMEEDHEGEQGKKTGMEMEEGEDEEWKATSALGLSMKEKNALPTSSRRIFYHETFLTVVQPPMNRPSLRVPH
jgi:hypothetical protein